MALPVKYAVTYKIASSAVHDGDIYSPPVDICQGARRAMRASPSSARYQQVPAGTAPAGCTTRRAQRPGIPESRTAPARAAATACSAAASMLRRQRSPRHEPLKCRHPRVPPSAAAARFCHAAPRQARNTSRLHGTSAGQQTMPAARFVTREVCGNGDRYLIPGIVRRVPPTVAKAVDQTYCTLSEPRYRHRHPDSSGLQGVAALLPIR